MTEMRDKGFGFKPYNPYVANRMIGGKKTMVFCHVDNLKVSHVDPKELSKFMEWMEGIYKEPRITRVRVYDYSGMAFDFRNPGELQTAMVNGLKGVWEDFSEVIMERSMILAADQLFQVRPEDNQKLLYKDRETGFHRTVAQLLFFIQRARKYIKISIAFLCKRVRKLDRYEPIKLVRVLR